MLTTASFSLIGQADSPTFHKHLTPLVFSHFHPGLLWQVYDILLPFHFPEMLQERSFSVLLPAEQDHFLSKFLRYLYENLPPVLLLLLLTQDISSIQDQNLPVWHIRDS